MSGTIIQEWFAKSGGSEKVAEAFSEAFPDADVFSLWDDAPERRETTHSRESFLSRTPLRRYKSAALPFMPLVWRAHTPRPDSQWLLVSSHLFAHHIRASEHVPKFVYAHTPARYLWAPELDDRAASPALRPIVSGLKALDRARAQEAHAVAANSEFVAERIAHAWDREARVIYPPVEVSTIQSVANWHERLSPEETRLLETLPETYVLGASRFVPYKKLERVIEAGEELGLPVVIAGSGPDEDVLRRRASDARVPVTFVLRPSDALLFSLYARALAYVFPPIEDFGIMPVEAMAVGCPVVTSNVGGQSESVLRGGAGVGFDPDAPASEIARAVERASGIPRDRVAIAARRFSRERFVDEVRSWVRDEA